MTRTSAKHKVGSGRAQFHPRHLLLAGLGAASLARKQVASAYADGFENVAQLGELAREAKDRVRNGLAPVLAKLGVHAKPVRRTAARRKSAGTSRRTG